MNLANSQCNNFMLVRAKTIVVIITNKDRFEIQGEALDGEFELKGIVHPKMKICRMYSSSGHPRLG